jgi:hypothetical protein
MCVCVCVCTQYRTVAGFRALVWREFVRVHGDLLLTGSSTTPRRTSASMPAIYIVFLDCVWQLVQLHPRAFEFGELFLEAEFECYLQGNIAKQLKTSSVTVPAVFLNPLFLPTVCSAHARARTWEE